MATAPPWAPPLLALQFLTRIPVPALARLTAAQARDGMARAMAWLPLVGTAIGAATASVFVAAGAWWPPLIAALLALAIEALLTGAFHEDAVADFCDAFGGTARGDAALRIMRDSRIGSYGTLGLGLAVAMRVAAIVALPPALAVAAIVGAATLARLAAVLLAAILPPAQPDGAAARMGRGMPPRRVLLGVLLAIPGLLPIALLRPTALLGAGIVTALLLGWLTRFLRARIGGSTGDCLGFAAYMAQLALLLAAVA
ncbi:adenosylcobinamide-GDP ribazoletransferase [Sphingomonas insulae]|uniref:Adenosylcobinamide-GDP ribazoletransferase n=1 Tax=Sphingomonas insulae TaxID=424800 RepID=A0ABP3T2Z5_9SPHN|nr:adenosylcobinamide-GDP ribazoletransferase [Sphingomonas insulae]NIJ30693.1 adenosylcobinamide-GDP ribazoletransferase [Sphingomonas insulae]